MIKQLKRKFITISVFATALVLFTIIGSINVMNYIQVNKTADKKIDILKENDGKFPENNVNDFPPDFPDNIENEMLDNSPPPSDKHDMHGFSPETPFDTRFFTVIIDENGNVTDVDISHIAAISEADAINYTNEIYKSGKTKGFKGQYKFSCISINSTSTMYIYVDCERELTSFKTFLISSIYISLIGLFCVFILVFILSEKVVSPIKKANEKQKRFITDASHELKTPLTIIDANTEIIEMENGENEWTESTKKQIRRLSKLTNNLVILTKLDEDDTSLSFKSFALSEAIEEAISPYSSIAKTRNLNFTYNIEENISYNGNEENIIKAVNLLLDNAMKYTKQDGNVSLSLKQGKKSPVIEVKNDTDSIEKGKHDELFERFYRTDESRNSSTGGYGIGLSLVYAIVTAHKGKVTAVSDDGTSIRFKIQL